MSSKMAKSGTPASSHGVKCAASTATARTVKSSVSGRSALRAAVRVNRRWAVRVWTLAARRAQKMALTQSLHRYRHHVSTRRKRNECVRVAVTVRTKQQPRQQQQTTAAANKNLFDEPIKSNKINQISTCYSLIIHMMYIIKSSV